MAGRNTHRLQAAMKRQRTKRIRENWRSRHHDTQDSSASSSSANEGGSRMPQQPREPCQFNFNPGSSEFLPGKNSHAVKKEQPSSGTSKQNKDTDHTYGSFYGVTPGGSTSGSGNPDNRRYPNQQNGPSWQFPPTPGMPLWSGPEPLPLPLFPLPPFLPGGFPPPLLSPFAPDGTRRNVFTGCTIHVDICCCSELMAGAGDSANRPPNGPYRHHMNCAVGILESIHHSRNTTPHIPTGPAAMRRETPQPSLPFCSCPICVDIPKNNQLQSSFIKEPPAAKNLTEELRVGSERNLGQRPARRSIARRPIIQTTVTKEDAITNTILGGSGDDWPALPSKKSGNTQQSTGSVKSLKAINSVHDQIATTEKPEPLRPQMATATTPIKQSPSKPTAQGSWSQTKGWVSDKYKEEQQWKRMTSQLRRIGAESSPVAPKTLNEFLELKKSKNEHSTAKLTRRIEQLEKSKSSRALEKEDNATRFAALLDHQRLGADVQESNKTASSTTSSDAKNKENRAFDEITISKPSPFLKNANSRATGTNNSLILLEFGAVHAHGSPVPDDVGSLVKSAVENKVVRESPGNGLLEAVKRAQQRQNKAQDGTDVVVKGKAKSSWEHETLARSVQETADKQLQTQPTRRLFANAKIPAHPPVSSAGHSDVEDASWPSARDLVDHGDRRARRGLARCLPPPKLSHNRVANPETRSIWAEPGIGQCSIRPEGPTETSNGHNAESSKNFAKGDGTMSEIDRNDTQPWLQDLLHEIDSFDP